LRLYPIANHIFTHWPIQSENTIAMQISRKGLRVYPLFESCDSWYHCQRDFSRLSWKTYVCTLCLRVRIPFRDLRAVMYVYSFGNNFRLAF